ncbi:MAG: carboxypeptidase regulatory-like domain-containing protein [Acidobacteria bacterium]|nr:carboxypeptidase regulatory-like domain-containing protein [Acidobacteriota bacterium]MBI1983880.1 carboxypeptidase regulatory-like domain-containing protein [Acidobacteriota bacterium]
MNKENARWFWIVVVVLMMVGCGAPEPEVSEQPEAPAEQAATPIDQSTVGSIGGKISFEGTKPKLARIMMDQDPVCVEKHSGPVYAEDGMVNDDGTLPNAFVYVKTGAEKYNFPTPTGSVELDQDGCLYKPHVLGIMAGQTLQILTKDPTSHNIHPMPKDNREWNLSQPPGGAAIEQKFSRPEIMIPVKCNQHPWMRAYIGVTRHPFFAVTGKDGTFTLKGLPPGEYTIEAWTATFGTQEQKVTVGPSEAKTADFSFKSS